MRLATLVVRKAPRNPTEAEAYPQAGFLFAHKPIKSKAQCRRVEALTILHTDDVGLVAQHIVQLGDVF